MSGGIFRPIALSDGRAVATWGIRAGQVEIDPFAPLAGDVAGALDDDARDVLRFLAMS